MIEKVIEFVRLAGEYQIKMRQNKDLNVKYKDNTLYSIVSETDLNISKMFKEYIEKEFGDLNYCIIDEESFAKEGDSIFEKIEKSEYLFVLDPVDGTLQYSQNIPLFGVSFGVFKNKVPYAGAIYMPMLKELVYSTEEQQAYWVKNAFTAEAETTLLPKEFKTSSALVMDLQRHFKLDYNKNDKGYLFADYLCSVFSYILLTTTRIRSGIFKDWIWDMAGAWPILHAVGCRLYDVKSNKYIEKYDRTDFNSNLQFKNAHLIGSTEEIEYLKKLIIKDWAA